MLAQQKLINWYAENCRNLPWRNTKNPYKIWLSEVLLQQTRVEQGLPYYMAFVKNFSTIKKLADANLNDVYKLWQGLGYYSRAKNMHQTAKTIAFDLKGNFPSTYNDLLKLKGVGSYTAAAIASFAFNKPVAVLDGNVFRVLSRYFGLNTPINTTNGKKEFTHLANSFLNQEQPAMHNQAMMELGALVCTPKNVQCNICPLNDSCHALKNNMVSNLPVKLPKAKPRNRYFNYIFITNKNITYLTKRENKDIWQNLYEPILIESDSNLTLAEFEDLVQERKLMNTEKTQLNFAFFTKHQLTHQTIFANFYTSNGYLLEPNQFEAIKLNQLDELPIHRLFEKFLTNHKLQKTLK